MDPSLIYLLDVANLSRQAAVLPRDAIRLATLFDGHRTLGQVLTDSFLSSRMTMSVFSQLRKMGIVAARAAEPSPQVIPATPEPAPMATPEPAPGQVAPEAAPDKRRATTVRIRKPLPGTPAIAETTMDSDTIQVDMVALHPAALTPPTAAIEPAPAPVTAPRIEAAPVAAPPPITEKLPQPDEEPAPAPAPVTERLPEVAVEPRAEPAATPAMAHSHTKTDFDDSDLDFFESYVPEDSSVDTFWDLEECPRKQREAKARELRLNRRKRGFLASLLLT